MARMHAASSRSLVHGASVHAPLTTRAMLVEMRRRVVLALILCAPLAPKIGTAQTSGHDDGTEEGEPVPSASASASVPLHPVVAPHAVVQKLSLIHISEPTRLLSISYAVFCLKKKK